MGRAVATAVAGSVGVIFTWLTGSQGRKQVDGMATRAEVRSERERSMAKRRNAYLATMRITRPDMQRFGYLGRNDLGRLEEIDRMWPKGERFRMAAEAEIAVDAFGSPAARAWQKRSHEAYPQKDLDKLKAMYEDFLAIVRQELGTTTLTTELEGGR
jgi:hypothetical protein